MIDIFFLFPKIKRRSLSKSGKDHVIFLNRSKTFENRLSQRSNFQSHSPLQTPKIMIFDIHAFFFFLIEKNYSSNQCLLLSYVCACCVFGFSPANRVSVSSFSPTLSIPPGFRVTRAFASLLCVFLLFTSIKRRRKLKN